SGAHGDYSSTTVGGGIELRRWLHEPAPMRGWYAAARTDVARTSVEETMEHRDVGALATWSFGVATGYRWVIYDRVEVTRSVGLAEVIEDGLARRAPTCGLTVGAWF